jgi:hypothetical protein
VEENKPSKLEAIAAALKARDQVILATDCDREPNHDALRMRYGDLFREFQRRGVGFPSPGIVRPTLDRPRVIKTADAQFAALHALRIAMSAAKRSALKLMHNFPEHARCARRSPTSQPVARVIYEVRSRGRTRERRR